MHLKQSAIRTTKHFQICRMLKIKIKKGETKLFSVTLLIPAALLSVKTNVSYVNQQKLKVSSWWVWITTQNVTKRLWKFDGVRKKKCGISCQTEQTCHLQFPSLCSSLVWNRLAAQGWNHFLQPTEDKLIIYSLYLYRGKKTSMLERKITTYYLKH